MIDIIFMVIDFRGDYNLNKLVDLGYKWHSTTITAEFIGKGHRYVFSKIDENRIRLTMYPVKNNIPLIPESDNLSDWIKNSLNVVKG